MNHEIMNDNIHNSHIPKDECNAFQKCIKSYILKRKKRFLKKRKLSSDEPPSSPPSSFHKYSQQAIHLTNHGIYILKTLTIKRRSLSIAIDAFYIISRECISCISAFNRKAMNTATTSNGKQRRSCNQKSPSSSSCPSSSLREIVQVILTHIFTQYIHLRDGFVLLTSGECRHTADANTAQKNGKHSSTHKFQSKLSQLQERGDGYTKKYSSNCGYSGYAWDEFFDEEVGVKRRLLDVLLKLSSGTEDHDDHVEQNSHAKQQKRNDLWDTSLGSGSELFENAFDNHANAMKDLQRKLENYRMKILHELQNVLNSSTSSVARSSFMSSTTIPAHHNNHNITITMVTEDKFERLELKNAKRLLGLESFSIQREGDTFKGNDKRGALPSNMSIQDWKEIMKLPLVLHQIIHDNDSHDNKKNDNKKPQPSKKRINKLVICDSSDDDDEDDKNNDHDDVNEKGKDPDSTHIQNTLKVTFKEILQGDSNNTDHNANNDNDSTPIRIHDIKKQHGVNADELQRSREELEEEEMISKKAAIMDEIGCDDEDNDDNGNVPFSNQSSNQHTRQQHPNPSRIYNGDIELNTSNLRMNRNGPTTTLPLERNDVLHNESSTSNHYLLEPTERIIIGAKKQKRNLPTSSFSSRNDSNAIDANRDFKKFGIQLEDGDDEACFEEDGDNHDERQFKPVQKYRKWGDEILRDLGIDINKYPGCAPEKPPEMIKELGL